MIPNDKRRLTELWEDRHTHDDDNFQEQITLLKTTVEEQADDIVRAGVEDCGVTTKQLLNKAAPHAVYVNDRQATYDVVSKKTYIAFLGKDRDLFVTFYDHEECVFGSVELVGATSLDADDDHSAPSITLDHDGHIHIVWASHSTPHKHVKSDNPWDISSWTSQTLSGGGTYASINCDPESGDLYILSRAGTAAVGDDEHDGTYPSEEFGSIWKSTDGGVSWAGPTMFVDTTGVPEATSDFYPYGSYFADDGYLHMSWTVARGAVHDDVRTNIYHAKMDPADDNWYTADGTSLGSSITWAEHADCLVATRDPIGVATLAVWGARIAVAYSAGSDAGGAGPHNAYVSVWDGSSWTEGDLGVDLPDTAQCWPSVWPVKGGWRAAVPVLNGLFGDVVLYGALPDGDAWAEIGTILAGTSGEGFCKVSPVRGGEEVVALTMQDPASFAATDATSSDLLPVYVLADEQAVLAPVDAQVSTHSHDALYYTEAEVDALVAESSGGGEILISDTPSSPLVFADLVQNEDQVDLVYSD